MHAANKQSKKGSEKLNTNLHFLSNMAYRKEILFALFRSTLSIKRNL